MAPKSLVKIGSVTAKIFLICANVARTNVVWTNVTVTVASVKDGPRNLPLKFDQTQVSNCYLYSVVKNGPETA